MNRRASGLPPPSRSTAFRHERAGRLGPAGRIGRRGQRARCALVNPSVSSCIFSRRASHYGELEKVKNQENAGLQNLVARIIQPAPKGFSFSHRTTLLSYFLCSMASVPVSTMALTSASDGNALADAERYLCMHQSTDMYLQRDLHRCGASTDRYRAWEMQHAPHAQYTGACICW